MYHCFAMAETQSSEEASWLDLLPARKLFSRLREKPGSSSSGSFSGNTMCVIKENLFIWSKEELALLTLNLKRLCASPTEDIFQVRMCTDSYHSNNSFNYYPLPAEMCRGLSFH